jgi:hypothetical protein
MKSPFTGLLFMHGYITDAQLARRLAADADASCEPPAGRRVWLLFALIWRWRGRA